MAGPLSYSSYRTYQECPLRWKFLYVDRRPEAPKGYFTFGRVIHAVLEELVRPLVEPAARRYGGQGQTTLDAWKGGPPAGPRAPPSLEEMLAAYDRNWSSEGYGSPDEEARYRTLGRELLVRFHEHLVRVPPHPVAVEEHLEAEWEGIPIHGYIDRIDRVDSGGLEIVDYKTSRELAPDEARSSDQLALYQVLVERNYHEPVHGLTLLHLRSLRPVRALPRSPPALEPLHARLGEVADGIREQAYEPTPGRHCARCEFQSICPEFRTVAGPDGERLAALVDRFQRLREEEGRLEGELAETAASLHRAAEELGVHRVPGSRTVAVRRREIAWQYTLDAVRPLLESSGAAARLAGEGPEEVRKFLRDPKVPAAVRRKVAETGSRRVRWYWELAPPENGGS